MKLDKIKFAMLISHLERKTNHTFSQPQMVELDEFINIEAPTPEIKCNDYDLHQLMLLMKEGQQKIEAIKYHRKMTGYGLKESKDIVDKYWPEKVVKTYLNDQDELYKLLQEGKASEEDQQEAAKWIKRLHNN